MHFSMGIVLIAIAVRWGDLSNWKRYYPTLLYIISMNLLYEYFSLHQFRLWSFSSDGILFHTNYTISIWHIFVINPAFTFLYLSRYPEGSFKYKLWYFSKWIFVCCICEAFLYYHGLIQYKNGWTYWWTVFFHVIMFMMLRLHYKRPFAAMPLSVFFTLFFLFMFDYF